MKCMRRFTPGFVLMFSSGSAHTCQSICENLESCSKGSYCKSWQSFPVCYGLYYTGVEQSSYCYFPDDPNCPEDYPVECPEDHPEIKASSGDPALNMQNVSRVPELEVVTISLAEANVSLINKSLPSVSNNSIGMIQVFDWVPDNSSDPRNASTDTL
jgi:hypothetical protein